MEFVHFHLNSKLADFRETHPVHYIYIYTRVVIVYKCNILNKITARRAQRSTQQLSRVDVARSRYFANCNNLFATIILANLLVNNNTLITRKWMLEP